MRGSILPATVRPQAYTRAFVYFMESTGVGWVPFLVTTGRLKLGVFPLGQLMPVAKK